MTNNASENKTSALAGLLNKLDLPTIAMIVLMGGGNFLQTKAGNDFNAQEIERATREIHDLYPKLMEALKNQQTMLTSDSKELQNQGLILENQRRILELLQKNHP